METGNKLRLADVFVTINDPRQSGKVEHDLVELLVVAVNAVLVGADIQLFSPPICAARLRHHIPPVIHSRQQ